jgi:CspA family cold shock protein
LPIGIGFKDKTGDEMVHTGEIKRVVRDRGFGFISDNDGRELFFHQSSVESIGFDTLREGQKVEFDVETSTKGPRAVHIRMVVADAI